MADPADSEHRREHRKRVLKGASILLGVKQSEISCLVRNMSPDGAEIRVSIEAILPESFLLYISTEGIAYRCTVQWRAGERVGVSFQGTEPKPHWHYGATGMGL